MLLLIKHHSMTSSPAPGSMVHIPSTGRRNSSGLSLHARLVCPRPRYWWPRRDYMPRTTVCTTDATAKTLSTFDLVQLPTKIERNVAPWPVSSTRRETDTTDIHSGTWHHYSHRPPPHHRHLQSRKCREPTHGALFLNGTGSRFYVSPRQLIPQCRSPPTLTRLTARPSPLTDDCLIASTWDYAATTRSASIHPNNAIRSSLPRTL
jgi:hypothetical protein